MADLCRYGLKCLALRLHCAVELNTILLQVGDATTAIRHPMLNLALVVNQALDLIFYGTESAVSLRVLRHLANFLADDLFCSSLNPSFNIIEAALHMLRWGSRSFDTFPITSPWIGTLLPGIYIAG